MKLNFESPEHEGTEPIEQQSFGIRDKDMHIIIDMLRAKLYKDPVRAVCREYMCNARDAHREVGTPDLPIEVTLPTALNRQLMVRDFGPGISPRRMADIFLNYGASTKRRSNVQTGCFGIGGKSALALSDRFSVVSIYGGVKRHYTAFIDSTKMGRMDLTHEEHTTEHTGTTIIVPIKDGDESRCAQAVISETRYWPVRPTLINLAAHHEYPQFNEPLLAEEGLWSLGMPTARYRSYGQNYSGHEGEEAMAIVDGIAYKVEFKDLALEHKDENAWMRSLLSKHLLMHFKTGQISLVPSRDNILFDESTISTIIKRLEKVRESVHDHTIEKVRNSESLLAAELFWEHMKDLLPWVGRDSKGKEIVPVWNGFCLRGTDIVKERGVDDEVHIRYYHLDNNRTRPKNQITNGDSRKLSMAHAIKIKLTSNTAVYWNDTDKSRGFVRRIDELVRPSDGSEVDIKGVYFVTFPNNTARDRWLSELRLNELGAKKASTLPNAPVAQTAGRQPKSSTGPRETIDCWVFDPAYRGTKEHEIYWRPTTIDKYQGVSTETALYVESLNKAQQEFECGLLNRTHLIAQAIKHFDIDDNVYLIPRRLTKSIDPSWQKLYNVVSPQIQALFTDNPPGELANIRQAERWLFSNNIRLSMVDRVIFDGMLDAEHIISKYYAESKVWVKKCNEAAALQEVQERFYQFKPSDTSSNTLSPLDHPLKSVFDGIRKRYPFLFVHSTIITEQQALDYIQAMDTFYSQQEEPVTEERLTTIDADSQEPENYCIAV